MENTSFIDDLPIKNVMLHSFGSLLDGNALSKGAFVAKSSLLEVWNSE